MLWAILVVSALILAGIIATIWRLKTMRQEIRDEFEALRAELAQNANAVESALSLITTQNDKIKALLNSGADDADILEQIRAVTTEVDAQGTRLANAVVAGTSAEGVDDALEEAELPPVEPAEETEQVEQGQDEQQG